ncbi:MAG: hypothetical protein H6811_09205 [Phycisphaeraceae bacterium]|nr:hypothetical protein [Phycisphaeraceae bacterium]
MNAFQSFRTVQLQGLTPAQRFLYTFLIALGLVIGLLIIIPIAVLAAILAVIATLVRALRRWTRSLWAPNGPMDGRRNVRVIVRD